MMGITRSLNTDLFTTKFTQTTTSMYNPQLSATNVQGLSTTQIPKVNLLINHIYTLYTGPTTTTNYLNKKET